MSVASLAAAASGRRLTLCACSRRFVIVVNTFEWVLKLCFSRRPAAAAAGGARVQDPPRRRFRDPARHGRHALLRPAVAVITGRLFSAFMFAMETGTRCAATRSLQTRRAARCSARSTRCAAASFFGSVTQFLDLFTVMEDPVDNVLRLRTRRLPSTSRRWRRCRLCSTSASTSRSRSRS